MTGQVQSYYESFLHRRADAPGLAAFVAARRHGMSADQVVQMVAGSDEYFQTRGGGTNDGNGGTSQG